jgi:hypothetical protein
VGVAGSTTERLDFAPKASLCCIEDKLVGPCLFEDDFIRVVSTTLPYFVAYELGVFSRYLPGMKSAAKRLE